MSGAGERFADGSVFALTRGARSRMLSGASMLHPARVDDDRPLGELGFAKGSRAGRPPSLSRLMDRRLALQRRFGVGNEGALSNNGFDYDRRQRAVVKLHYFNHAGGGGAALKAHASYVARDAARGAEREADPDMSPEADRADERARDGMRRTDARDAARSAARAHAAYLTRSDRGPVFYDASVDGVDGAARAAAWARSDKRHFRLVLSAEQGAHLADLPAYTRQVMARAEALLDTKLSWIAVDHHDTDNPHTHIILRGRRANGQDLIIPRDLIKHGLRDIARDVATQWLGERSLEDERRARDRETRAHAPTRLDRLIAAQLSPDGAIRIADLNAPNGDPDLAQALKARARTLQRLGLAHEVKRNMLAFEPDWRERLETMQVHLDIRRRIVRERAEARAQEQARALKRGRDMLDH